MVEENKPQETKKQEEVKEEPKEEKPAEVPKEEVKPAEPKTGEKKINLIYAALLLNSAGKKINEENIKKVAETVSSVDDSQVKALVAALEGVNIDETISKAAMPMATAPAAQSEVSSEAKEEEKEEEIEKKSEEAAAGLGALFG